MHDIEREYFNYVCHFVSRKDCKVGGVSYKSLLSYLYTCEFIPVNEYDENCANNGLSLRTYYLSDKGEKLYSRSESAHFMTLEKLKPCSMLEMMVSLARNMDDIMYESQIGDRVSQWFWSMIRTLGLGGMYDENYDEALVCEAVARFNERKYSADGQGGLFYVKSVNKDMRDLDVWAQACWYMDHILGY